MSQRYLAPTNLFYSKSDPNPDFGFPVPSTGDVYYNTVSQTIRIFYEDAWHDATGGVGGGPPPSSSEFVLKTGDTMTGPLSFTNAGEGVMLGATAPDILAVRKPDNSANAGIQCADPEYADWAATKGYVDNKMIVSTSPPSGVPDGGVGTVWIQY